MIRLIFSEQFVWSCIILAAVQGVCLMVGLTGGAS